MPCRYLKFKFNINALSTFETFRLDAHFVTGWSDAPDATWMIIPDEMGT